MQPSQKPNPKIIKFHYRREKEDYQDWCLFTHKKGSSGNSFYFSEDKENPGYVFTCVPLALFGDSLKKVWFKVCKISSQDADERMNRFVSIDRFGNRDSIDVYLRNGDTKVYYQKPKLKNTKVNVYYHRHEHDYSNWSLSYFIDKRNNSQTFITGFETCNNDPTFKKVSFELDFKENAKELNFYLRNGCIADSIDYRKVLLKEGELDVFMVQDIYQTFQTKDEAQSFLTPRILKAVLNNPGDNQSNFNTIWAETNIALPDEIITNPLNFAIKGEDKSSVSIINVQYTDSSKRRYKLTLGDFELHPFNTKYDLKVDFSALNKVTKYAQKINFATFDETTKGDNSLRISIHRLFDHIDFNQKYCFLHENIPMDFGLIFGEEDCYFTLWSPTADIVKLHIYKSSGAQKPLESFKMHYESGLWYIKFTGSSAQELLNMFYTFEVITDKDSIEIIDPYAKACGTNAQKAAIINLRDTDPIGWSNHKRPNGPLLNPIIYELHIKDFTMGTASDVPAQRQGKYLGVIDKIPHLKSLGINCVQLLPVTKYDTDESISDGGDYNWGYDQKGLWFLPEGIYSTEAHNPKCRIKEFKEMVMALHQNGIRVVIDAVHNHTYETENCLYNSIINAYYYRQAWDDSFVNGSGCGNELKTERPIVGKLIRDYLKYWVGEMGVDGFRFDLMSLTDKFTMQNIRKDLDSVHPYILLYGEAYKMGWSILPYELQSTTENIMTKELTGIGVFTDVSSRNAIRGYNYEPGLSNGAPIDSVYSQYYFWGQKGEFINENVRNNPTQKVYNYIDIHDDLLLIDYLNQSSLNISREEIIQRYKLAYTILFNYIGPIVLKSGFEGLTTKYGDSNSYRSEDVNLIDWTRMEKHSDTFKYFSDYIKFRLSHPAYVMSRHDVNTKFEYLDCHNGYVKGKMFKDYANGDPCNKLLIYHNLSKASLDVNLPSENGGWALLANENTVGNTRIGHLLSGKFSLPPLSTIVLGDNISVEKLMKFKSNPLAFFFAKNY